VARRCLTCGQPGHQCQSPQVTAKCEDLTTCGTGRAVLVEAAPGHVEAVNRLIFDVLTKTQARQLGIIAGRILNAIDAETDLRSLR
jgi:hypothetical protein